MADVTRIAERYCAAGLKYSVCAKRVVTTVGNWFVFFDASCVTNHDSDRKQIQLMRCTHIQIRSERGLASTKPLPVCGILSKIYTEAENITKKNGLFASKMQNWDLTH